MKQEEWLATGNTSMADYLAHLALTDEELKFLDDLMDARRADFLVEELGDRFVIRYYGNKAMVGWFEGGNLQVMTPAQFKLAHAEKFTEIVAGGDVKRVPLVDHWLKHPRTRRYDRVEFMPGKEAPSHVLNLWRGWPERTGWEDFRLTTEGAIPNEGIFDGPEMPEGYCDLFLDHMREHMCDDDPEVFRYLLGWMADALWTPGPVDTAIVLKGSQGSGKTFWAERFMEFFGVHSLTLDSPEQVVGNFNTHLMNKSVIFADEAFFAGNRAHAAKLKTLVTRPDLFVEPKGVDGFVARKMFRLIMASNDDHVIRAEFDDRRYLVLKVDAGRHNQDGEYFGAMMDEWRTGGRRALFRWLTGRWWGEQVAEGRFKRWKRPVTEGLNEQKDMSLPPAQMIIHTMLQTGELPADCPSNTDCAVFVPTRLMAEKARLDVAQETALGRALGALASGKSERVYLGEGRDRRQWRGYWLPALNICRERWEGVLGRRVDWTGDAESWALEPGDNVERLPF